MTATKKTTAKKTTTKPAAKKSAPKDKPKTAARAAEIATTTVATPLPTEPAETPKKKAGKKKPATEATPKKMSALDAAAKVLEDAGEPMNTKQMIDAMAAKGLWTSPGGKTPHATLYSAILREIGTKENESRFRKTDKGHFAAKKNT